MGVLNATNPVETDIGAKLNTCIAMLSHRALSQKKKLLVTWRRSLPEIFFLLTLRLYCHDAIRGANRRRGLRCDGPLFGAPTNEVQ
jgi:hypothetical protein